MPVLAIATVPMMAATVTVAMPAGEARGRVRLGGRGHRGRRRNPSPANAR